MKKLFLLLFLASLSSCSSDSSVDLSGGYFLIIEGKGSNIIVNRSAKTREIPSNIISYGFSDHFIIAKQKPDEVDNVIFTPTTYKEGRDKIYFWLIVHKEKLVLGPMSEAKFKEARKKYKVPDELKLESVY
jgi:hypothetical protein